MFQLKIANNDVSSGSLTVSWCIDQEILNKLVSQNIKDPQVVIIIAPVNNYSEDKEVRKVVPLKDLIAFLELKSSGLNNIYAFVPFVDSVKEVKNRYMSRTYCGIYKTTILSFDGNDYDSLIDNTSSPLTIDVPADIFAKEPANWEKTWVNHLFKNKAYDQCDFRKRRIFAYSIQPFVIFYSLFIRCILICFGGLFLFKNTSFKYLTNPLLYSIYDTFIEITDSPSYVNFTINNKHNLNTKLVLKHSAKTMFMAFLLPPIWALTALLVIFHLYILLFLIYSITAILIMISIFELARIYSDYNIKSEFQSVFIFLEKFSLFNFFAPKDPWFLNKQEVEFLTCEEDKPVLTYQSLPNHHKTIKLRFQNLKQKVCRPFSQ